eukprot:6953194-Heterocapsa_arctica.AAC.1
MCDHELRDASDLDPAAGAPRPQLIVGRPRHPAPARQAPPVQEEEPSPPSQDAVFGHRLRIASAPFGGVILCCTACGAYAYTRAKSLRVQCPGNNTGPGLAAQRRRLSEG